MFTYSITGRTMRNNDTLMHGQFYSGYHEGRDNLDMVKVHGIGPIPPGRYRIGQAITHPQLGPLAMPLIPLFGTDTFGRSGFYIHGDSISHPGEASHGCIAASHDARVEIDASRDRVMMVVPGNVASV